MVDFHSAAVRFGKPGKLWVNKTTAVEPTSATEAWPTGWVPLGYTHDGSSFNYDITTENVEVAEELDILARVTTGRNAHVEVHLAEMTYKNLTIAFNGGILTDADQDGSAWSFEPPDLGTETRIMIGWDAWGGPITPGTGSPPGPGTYPKNDLRWIFRQCLQGGSVVVENRKGNTKSTIAVNFQLEKPESGKKILKIMGSGVLNPSPA